MVRQMDVQITVENVDNLSPSKSSCRSRYFSTSVSLRVITCRGPFLISKAALPGCFLTALIDDSPRWCEVPICTLPASDRLRGRVKAFTNSSQYCAEMPTHRLSPHAPFAAALGVDWLPGRFVAPLRVGPESRATRNQCFVWVELAVIKI